eukprot:maker-scaffold_2-snap-gene-9.5-mRNA-1 protein AED:0.84 eAED:0.84 QI:0/0/0/0.5/1/1/2/0/68
MKPATLNRLGFLKMNQDELMDRNKVTGFDDDAEEDKEMKEESEEEEREELTLEWIRSCDKDVHSDDEA